MRLHYFFVLSAAAMPALAGDTILFERIPMTTSANDMTPDGRYIVGGWDADGDFIADGTYRYDTLMDEMLILPPEGLVAAAVSDDGSVIVGEMPDPEDPDPVLGVVAAMWTEANGWQDIGYLPNALECPSRSDSYEISADGSVIVGLSWDGCSGRGFVWDAINGMRELESLANGNNRASVVSADGTVIGGFAQGTSSRTPAIWDAATTDGELLDPPSGDVIGEVHGIRDDGSVLLINWLDPAVTTSAKAATWTESGGVEIIENGSFRPGWVGVPQDIADDGTIVGFDNLFGNRVAWLQPQGTGPILELKPWLEAAGNVFDPTDRLEVIQAITTDGSRFIGHGFGTGAWMVTITPDCPADLAPPAGLDFFDVLEYLGLFDAEDPAADLAPPFGVFDFFDVLEYLAAFDAGCP